MPSYTRAPFKSYGRGFGDITATSVTTTGAVTIGGALAAQAATFAGAVGIAAGAVGAPSLYLVDSPTTGLYRGGSNDIRMTVNGSDSMRWQTSQVQTNNHHQVNGNLLVISGYIEGTEIVAPSAPAANRFRLFAVEDGGAKTDLNVLFQSGVAQPVAGEP